MEGFYEAVISYFQQPYQGNTNSFASAHFCVNSLQNGNDAAHSHVENNPSDAPAGEITQMVREKYWAWHVLCWNTYMFGTEHEGFVNSPAWYSEAMYQASAGLQHHLCATYNIPMDRNHIIGHNEWQNSAWTGWMATNWPQIDTTCNNHTDPGQYWNWTHFMALVIGTNLSPTISSTPLNRAIDQGASTTFNVMATGTTPLTYKWLFNGSAISGATASNYNLANVQLSNSGSYLVVITNPVGSITSSVAILTVNPTPAWVVVYADNFDTNSSVNWKLFQASSDGVSDYATNWAFDYSTNTYTFNGVTQTIPVAPSTTNGTRLGLRLTANKKDADAAAAGVSLYPKNLTMSGNYALRFDMWLNYNGSSGGGSGSTEYATFGINHAATEVNWGAGTASSSDGLWFGATGEGGAANDYVAYTGNSAGNPTALSFAAGGFGVNGALSQDAADPLYVSIFSSPTYETPGSPGKHWVQGEVSQVNGVITWKFNGVVMAERTNTTAYTNGDIMLGYMDIFPSIANPPQDNYVIFDNVQVLMAGVAPTVTAQPQNFAVIQGRGTNATFTVSAAGFPAPTYQWQFNGTNLPSATTASYTVVNPQGSNAGSYSVLISNFLATATSSNATLTVYVPPAIAASGQPVNRNVNQGKLGFFTATATGSSTLSYQWQFGLTNIVGATNGTCLIPNVQANQAGNYWVVVTNNYGAITSAVATLTVNTLPVITSQPQGSSVVSGSSATFTVTATGNPTPSYQWLFNGGLIGGATTNSYTVFHARTTNGGNYSVSVTNGVGSVTSSNAFLSITITPPQFQQISRGTNGGMQLQIAGLSGSTYAIDGSSNLVDWVPLTTFVNTNGTYQFIDNPANPVKGFYRVRWLSDN